MKISELGNAVGVDVETIRYYEKLELLPAPQRLDNGYRNYGAPHVERLAFIRHCRALDMPLAEIGQLLSFMTKPADDCSGVDALVASQLARVRARLVSMHALESQLMLLQAQCDASHPAHSVKECGILHELVAAAHGEACACHA
jgi:DNA-binding transcriptional MerR regulator